MIQLDLCRSDLCRSDLCRTSPGIRYLSYFVTSDGLYLVDGRRTYHLQCIKDTNQFVAPANIAEALNLEIFRHNILLT